MDKAKQDLDAVEEPLQEARSEDDGWFGGCEEERRQVLLRFAPLLQDLKFEFESKRDYEDRSMGTQPGLLGFVTPQDELDVQTLQLLCEPIELILPIPTDFNYSSPLSQSLQNNQLVPMKEYAIFATGDLMAIDRDDTLPMDFSASSTRSAQRRLFQLLSKDLRQKAAVISVPEVPSSVRLRGTEDGNYDAGACFDLSELVRDCNCPLEAPMAPTPEGEMEMLECPICMEPTGEADIALTPCAHKLCSECIVSVLDAATVHREPKGNCPECREVVLRSELTLLGDAEEAGTHQGNEPQEEKKMAAGIDTEISGFHLKSTDICSTMSQSSASRVVINRLTDKERRLQRAMYHTLDKAFIESVEEASNSVGTKISRLLDEVKLMMDKDPKSKCVIFSQFLGTRDVASQEMSARGISFVRVDGHMKQHQRADALHDFSSDANVRVFLLSMRAGAAGLNLMAADHCFILDAPLNTAIKEQAIDR
jgi:hypothetical protein